MANQMSAPEVREFSLTPKERAESRDNYVRVFDQQWADWSSIAKVCVDMDRDRDWEILGFASFNQYLVTAAPRSRSYLYLVIGRYRELSPDIPDEELAQIPLSNASVLKQLSPAVRKESKIRLGAKGKPAEFREMVSKEYPGQHIEPIVEQRLRFTLSAWTRIEAAWEAYKVIDESASLETFLEWAVSEQTT
jgi:hypothetical protein